MRFTDLDGPDFFRTPRWATFALIENEKFNGEIWECACGDGTMSRVLEETGQPVRSTDLYDRCFGEAGVDFLMSRSRADTDNPPSRLWVFSERITFYPAGVKPKGGGTTAYAWFVWTQTRWAQPN
jgi:hypothetical protein